MDGKQILVQGIQNPVAANTKMPETTLHPNVGYRIEANTHNLFCIQNEGIGAH